MVYGEIEQWKSFVHQESVYELSHLNAFKIVYVDSKTGNQYTFFVTFGLHCFTKDLDSLTEIERQDLLYSSRREVRPFNFERYNYSKSLPDLIRKLHEVYIFDAGYDNYATLDLLSDDGVQVNYKVVFKAFREKKKLRLHISSAYPVDDPGKTKKVGFFAIARNLLMDRPLPKNK